MHSFTISNASSNFIISSLHSASLFGKSDCFVSGDKTVFSTKTDDDSGLLPLEFDEYSGELGITVILLPDVFDDDFDLFVFSLFVQ